MNKVKQILNDIFCNIDVSENKMKIMQDSLRDFKIKFNAELKKLKIDASLFVGGSFAKKTVVRKNKYDVDIFVRFDSKYNDNEISNLTEKVLKKFKNVSKIHGSRDYFRINIGPRFYLEIVPVKKIKNLKNYENITDLSFSHVRYINKKVKNENVLNDIKLAKVFCHANNCYGAESYIKGFSGYSLELLITYYGSFEKFLKEMIKVKLGVKCVIDMEKLHVNKKNVLMDLNSSKLESPVILIDPTYKQRNALAALSEKTFLKFQQVVKKFLKLPSVKFFEVQKTDLEKIKKNALKKKQEFVLTSVKTNKQEGDVAGSKLLKFYEHMCFEFDRFFKIKKSGFNYNEKQSSRCYFVVEKRKEIIINGPLIKDKKNVKLFKKKHKNIFKKKDNLFAREKVDFDLKSFVKKWKIKNKQRIKEMYIVDVKLI